MINPITSIANMFRPTQQVTVASQPTVGPMGQQNPGAALPVPASGSSQPNTEAAPPNPLDELGAIWQNDPNYQPPVDPLSTPLFNTDPAKIQEAAAKMNFTTGVSQELLTKAMSGQDPAAFMQVLNAVAQRAVATSTQLNAATIEQATQRNNQRIDQALPSKMKRIQLDTMVPENPVLQHQASQPLLQLVRAQIQMKNPGLSAVEINNRAEQYLTGFANQLNAPTAAAAAATSQAAGTDWEAWIESSPSSS